MATYKETWTEVQSIAPRSLIKAELYRTTIDLTAAATVGAYLNLCVGTGGSTALTTGVDVRVIPLLVAGSGRGYGNPVFSARSRTAAGIRVINDRANPAAGSTSFAYDGAGGTAFAVGEKVFFWGVTSIPTSSAAISPAYGCEVLIAGKTSATPMLFASPSIYKHNDNEVMGIADTWRVWLPGGRVYSVVFDYLDDAAGEAVGIMADYESLTAVKMV